MARINIEDSLYKDARFINLYMRLQSIETALGALVRAWSVAQKWYLTEQKMIPLEEWKKQGLNDALIVCGLATEINGFIKMAGAEEQFAWLVQKVNAGRRGGLTTKDKKIKQVDEIIEEKENKRALAGAKQRRSGEQRALADVKPLSLSLPLSPSLSQAPSLNTGEAEKVDASAPTPVVNNFIKIYCEKFKEKYGTNPQITAKQSGIAKRIVQSIGVNRSTSLLEKYLSMNDRWFVTKRHDLATFESNLNAVAIALDTGNTITQGELKQLDRSETLKNQISRIEKGEQ